MSIEAFGSPGAHAPLITIGDITVTDQYVITPQGRTPVGQVYWTMTDMSQRQTSIPTWAIVMAILTFLLCLIGLLFLLAKEERTVGYAQIAVQGPGLYHAVQLPVSSPQDLHRYNSMVNYARSVTASRSSW